MKVVGRKVEKNKRKMASEAQIDVFAEWSEGQTGHLEMLHAPRNAHDGDAEQGPQNRWLRQASRPPNMSQMMSRMMARQPLGQSPWVTVEPKGHRQRRPSLNVCSAKGMPMIVTARATLPVKYPMADSRPPNSSHTMLPSIFIMVFGFWFLERLLWFLNRLLWLLVFGKGREENGQEPK